MFAKLITVNEPADFLTEELKQFYASAFQRKGWRVSFFNWEKIKARNLKSKDYGFSGTPAAYGSKLI